MGQHNKRMAYIRMLLNRLQQLRRDLVLEKRALLIETATYDRLWFILRKINSYFKIISSILAIFSVRGSNMLIRFLKRIIYIWRIWGMVRSTYNSFLAEANR
ncbi:hypothetial protein [Candidatus Ishikawaella capsulata Mpkobe]|uniref:Hypothetial protein n=1 Tax=Candidatus Ishikawaella capsulata Mpkobe TaxID=476281 RepID=C5WDL4_9ENTR|nr:hypothetial protein [Candidatus Ishikawaella capsulata Mpkobe]